MQIQTRGRNIMGTEPVAGVVIGSRGRFSGGTGAVAAGRDGGGGAFGRGERELHGGAGPGGRLHRGGGAGDGQGHGFGGDRLVGPALRVEVTEAHGRQAVRAGTGGHQHDILAQCALKKSAVLHRALGLGLHDLEVVRDFALRQAGDVGPVARAGQLKGPRDRFAHAGGGGDNLGYEGEFADRPAVVSRCRRQRLDGEFQRLGIDLALFDIGLAEQAERGAADHEVDQLAGGLERVDAGLLNGRARGLLGDDATLTADERFRRVGLGPVVGHGRGGGPFHVAGERMKVAAHHVEMVGEREDLAGPDRFSAGCPVWRRRCRRPTGRSCRRAHRRWRSGRRRP